jgi:2-oxoisovalerate dehydrogenase E1 component beta subunit
MPLWVNGQHSADVRRSSLTKRNSNAILPLRVATSDGSSLVSTKVGSGAWFDEAVAGAEPATGASYLDAISRALRDELSSDRRVVLLGEDIGAMGGAFRVTRGLFDEFGEERIIDTPMAEAGLIGMAIGLAVSGFRPIVELQFADFISCAYDMLVNEAAKLHYRFGIAVPIVIRCPSGAGVGAGPFHSQSPEGIFSHIVGLKVVCPGTVQDAYGLLRAAVADMNPVLYFEHKALYRSLVEPLEPTLENPPIGRAVLRRRGSKLTLVTYGYLVHKCNQVADEFAAQGIPISVLDLRTLMPLDKAAIVSAVHETGRVVIVHEDNLTYGVGAEVAAILADAGFFHLDAPVLRLAAPDSPVPTAKSLEDRYLPQAQAIRAAVEQCLSA